MELARLVPSNKQQPSNTQASSRAPSGPQSRRGPKIGKNVTTLSGIIFRNFLEKKKTGRTPRWSQRVIYWSFGRFWAAGTWRNFGPGSKTEKHDFPELGALLGENPSTPKVARKNCATFLHFAFWPTGTPRGGNSQNTGFSAILGPFGLGQPWARR